MPLQRLAKVVTQVIEEQLTPLKASQGIERLRTSVLSETTPTPGMLHVADLAIKLDLEEKEAEVAAQIACAEEKEAEEAAKRAEMEWQVSSVVTGLGFVVDMLLFD